MKYSNIWDMLQNVGAKKGREVKQAWQYLDNSGIWMMGVWKFIVPFSIFMYI